MFYFIIFGLYKLAILTYQDIKNKRVVDDRNNAFMIGVAATMVFFYHPPMWFLFLIILILIGFNFVASKFPFLGKGDINALAWIYLGYAIINPYLVLTFCGFIIVLSIIFKIVQYKLFQDKPLPYFPVIFLAFGVNSLTFLKLILSNFI